MNISAWQNMPADQIAQKLMEAYPNVNPAMFNAAPQQAPSAQSPFAAMAAQAPAAAGPFGGISGINPEAPVTAPVAAGDPTALMGLATSAMAPRPQAPMPMLRPGGPGGAPAQVGGYPAAGPVRQRAQSLGDLLGGLK